MRGNFLANSLLAKFQRGVFLRTILAN